MIDVKKQIIINNEKTYFYITDDGQLYNEKTDNWYKGQNKDGYISYDLAFNGTRINMYAHRLVASYFIPNPNNLPIVNHKDGNKQNNSVENLEWATYSENNFHAYRTGLKPQTNGIDQRMQYKEDLENEIWKQYEDTTYYISNKGRIKNIKTNNLLKGKVTSRGYIEWCLSTPDKMPKKKSYLAHRLVYQAFGGELKEGYVINHIDGDKTNNNINNLEQILPSENIKHSYYQLNNSNLKKVGKYDLEDNLIEVYASCADAARQNPGCYPNLICNVCNGKTKTHKGYKWKYLLD